VRLPPDRRRKKRTDEPAEETPRPARRFESRRRRQARHREERFSVAGADLNAFHVGDEVTMKCKLIGEGFKLKLLESATAHYELNG
jgi:sRNA-binding protein